MKEIADHDQLNAYVRAHQMEEVFPESLAPYIALYHFEPGEWICSQGQTLEYVYVLVKGKVKVYTNSAEGKTLILSFKTPPEVIGDIEYIEETDIINTVEAVSPVVMIGVHHTRLKQHAGEHPPFLRFMLNIIARKFYVKSTSLSFHLMHSVDVRLASYLLSVSSEERKTLSTASLKDAANLIGTSYRHMNRVLQSFSEKGWIERKRGSIVVKDREGLYEASGQSIYEK